MEFFYFYDIKLDTNGQIYLELITERKITEFSNGKNVTYYVEVNREIEYPDNIKKRINYLRALGCKCISTFDAKNFDLNNLRPIDNILVAIIEKGHILLDKVYDDKAVINGMNVIATYIHYIDSKTGIEYAKPMGCRTDITSEQLLKEGYTPMENSILMANITELSTNGYFGIELDVSSRELARN